MAQDPLVPTNSPFKYNVGINYETWNRTDISADLQTISGNFKLVRTYHDVWSGSPTTPVIDASQKLVIDYLVAHPGGPQLVMGTMNSDIAQLVGGSWAAGSMTSSAFTDAWVSKFTEAFGGAASMKEHVATILLGNELDTAGPPPGAAYQGWISAAFTNLSNSLAKAGLGSIPISTTIANYPSNPAANPTAANATAYILNNWNANWNKGSPFVLFNQYTPAGTTPVPLPATTGEAETTNYKPVIDYFKLVQSEITAVKAGSETFVGETGYSSYWDTASGGPGAGSQANVIHQIFDWLSGQYSAGHKTTPLFVFQAFDVPASVQHDVVQQQYGLYSGGKLKPGIVVPGWVKVLTSTQFGTAANDEMVGVAADDAFYGDAGNDSIDGGAGANTVVLAGDSASYTIKVAAQAATLTVQDKIGTDGIDQLTNIHDIQFNDTTIGASWITKTASLPANQVLKVVDLYTAGLNRAPDALGLDYWASRLADGASLGDVARGLFGSAEAAPLYSSANSNQVFVTLAYNNALGRAPDAAGAAYWINELQTGHIQRTDFVTALIAGARAPGGSAADAQYIANREAVGAHFALTQGLNNETWAMIVESAVNGSAASVTAANAQTDAFAAAAATAATSELIVQIVGLVP